MLGAPQPPPEADYRGWRARWLSPDPMYCRTPGDRPDIEISQGCEGTVTEYVRPGTPGHYGYRITFDNGAVFGTYLPAPRVIRLDPPENG